ncbi:MAG: hypothetical protein IV094_06645 [Vitreoscilla sp.]|nr:hypothetical protein [Vitreoscilla sp.]
MPRAGWRLAFAAALVGIFVIALLPTGMGEPLFPQVDKFQHAMAFGALWILGARAGCRPGWALGAGLLAYGVAIELAQGLTSYRDASAADVMADLAGMALAAWWLRRPTT